MCGKNSLFEWFSKTRSGSPPRVREKQNLKKGIYSNVRITPACAGKTLHRTCLLHLKRDHPRVCGKNSMNSNSLTVYSGSHPRVREKLKRGHRCHAVSGITPACAGKTTSEIEQLQVIQDHPRVCGKNIARLLICLSCSGSPPRVREKHNEHLEITAYHRITPAYAGKTYRHSYR